MLLVMFTVAASSPALLVDHDDAGDGGVQWS